MAFVLTACGKKSRSSSEESNSTGGLTVTGQLQLASTLALDGTFARQVVYFKILSGRVEGAPQKVSVAADGTFSFNVETENAKATAAKNAITQSPVDRAALKVAFPEYASQIDGMTDEQIIEGLRSYVDELVSHGGPQYVMVSYVPSASGDALAEAESFQFIGLPTGGANVVALPADSVKGDVALGAIAAGTGDDATASLKADGNVLNLSDSAITQLANISQTLKLVKNYWVNKSSDGTMAYVDAQPFFAWQGHFSDLVDGGSSASAPAYSGYGMYVQLRNSDLAINSVCPASGTQQSPVAPVTNLTLFPPASVPLTSTTNGVTTTIKTLDPSHPFNNLQAYQSSQNGKTICGGADTGFYGRFDGDGQWMLNWGTSGSIGNAVPAGWWSYKEDGSLKGSFDLSAGYPIDDNGHAKVLVPRVSVTKDGSNKVTGIRATFAVFNGATGTYEDASDLTVFKKMSSELMLSLSLVNGSGGMDEIYGGVGQSNGALTVAWDSSGTALETSVPAAHQGELASGWSNNTGKVVAIAASYVVGGSTYRFEFRP
ncbi:hypothetical protein EBZ80_10635 [bacterium]|nr:hypothetical protein [bacterium]